MKSKEYKCVLCSKRTKPIERRFLGGLGYKDLRKYLSKQFLIDVCDTDVTCSKCRNRFYRETQKKELKAATSTTIPLSTEKSPKSVTLPIQSLGGSHSTCFVCKRRGPKLVAVPASARHELFVDNNILIPAGSRCCPVHMNDASFIAEALSVILSKDLQKETSFNRTELMSLIETLRSIAKKRDDHKINFDGSSLSDNDYKNLMGINKEQFDILCTYIKPGSIRDTKVRSMKTCVGILLTKLRSGMSNKILSTVFSCSKDAVKRAINTARKALNNDFIPFNLGFEHISREHVIEKHTRPIAQKLFGNTTEDTAILVVDGTYIYIQKSTQSEFQRRSFSMHKHRSLVKPMVIVSTTGYVVSVFGPFLSDGKNNDANIIKHTFNNNVEDIQNWFKDDDVLVVDRGFRDSVEILEEIYGLKCAMPSFMFKGRKQMPCKEANSSRLVTKIRWVVESFNGRLKQWRYLDKVVPNSQIPLVGDYVRCIAAISNRFLSPLSKTIDYEADIQNAKVMLSLAKESNMLQDRVEREGLDKKRVVWHDNETENVVESFPKLTEEQIRGLTLGVYQLNMAKIYAQEHTINTEGFTIAVHCEDNHLLKAKLQSRHVSARQHKVYIEFSDTSVCAWYCTCRSGARVVGMCSHCATIIWYMSYARHQEQKWRSAKDWFDFIQDADKIPDVVDSSDDDSDADYDVPDEE